MFILKTKDQAFAKFKQWCVSTKNKMECKLKYLRTDNGPEFLSKEFTDFWKEKGISIHRTVKYTPQQNGLAERMNKSLLENARCMLLNPRLPKSFWGQVDCFLPH